MKQLFISLTDPNTLFKVILVLIPVVVVIIVISHYHVKAQFSLFQRRYVVYEKLGDLISFMVMQQGLDEEELAARSVAINEVKLLFGKKICCFVADVYRKNSELQKLKLEEHPELSKDETKKTECISSSHSDNRDEQQKAIQDKRDEIIVSLVHDFHDMGIRFKPYLKFLKSPTIPRF